MSPDTHEAPLRQLKLTLEYDGTALCGWQRQDNGPTVQGHLEDALGKLLREETRVTGASRTDAGVHARGQVACFRTTRTLPPRNVRRGLNTFLPTSIAVVDAIDVPAEFHPRYAATGKHYRYQVLARPERSPLAGAIAWHRPQPLDVAAMRAAAAAFVGDHDFAAFRAVGCTAKSTIRRIRSVAIHADGDLLVVDVHGNAFLRNMVRIMVGTLVDVGEGRLAAAQLPEIIASLDRERAGVTAPAHGLCLVAVHYDGPRIGTTAPPPRPPVESPPG